MNLNPLRVFGNDKWKLKAALMSHVDNVFYVFYFISYFLFPRQSYGEKTNES